MKVSQMSKIISKKYNDKIEIIFAIDKSIYLNATQTAKKFNKMPKDWLKTAETKNYISSIEKFYNLKEKELIIIKKGNFTTGEKQGTWIHKKLIVAFARWLSSDFAVWCDLQIEEILKSQNSQPIQTPQTLENLDLDLQISQNKKLLEFIELITSQNPKNLFFLDKIYKNFSEKSPLDFLQIDLNSFYFIPTELGKFLNKSAVEINKILEHKGYQFKEDGEWFLTEKGENFAFEFQNGKFKTIKWKLQSLI